MPHSTGRRASHQRADHRRLPSHAIIPSSGSSALERAILAALRQRRPQVLERLAEQAGAGAFARVLMRLSTRQMMDALSLLPHRQRGAVWARLSPAARRRWGGLAASTATHARGSSAAQAEPADQADQTDQAARHARGLLSGACHALLTGVTGALGRLRRLLATARPGLAASASS